MKISLGPYRSNTKFIKYCYDNCKHGDLVRLVSEISASVGIPCIVVNRYLSEIVGVHEKLDNNLETLKKTYSIKEIVE